ncbi:biogenesis of lysosome-related organelles complex 1 subunit 6-like [Montipora foliosa]|uniref:biogenesis of lysosome-related organelles complex 1 subunit 6-like n=1 Tax=Montipora foliosa TaxID=591990 RepID=UPI0035F12729
MSKSTEEEGPEAYGKNEDSGDDVKEMLTDGFMDYFMPSLENVQDRLSELTQNQGILIETIQQENDKYVDCHSARNLAVMLSYVRTYHSKLTKVKQDMSSVEDRVGKLKKRAMKLKLQKEKDERSKAEAYERKLELERQLTAKLASDHQQ